MEENTTTSSVTPYGYSGEYTDETGLQYLRSRYYDPSTGRFTQEDTWLDQGPNLYSYCNNDPVNNVDPSGHLVTPGPDGKPVMIHGIGFSAKEIAKATEEAKKRAEEMLFGVTTTYTYKDIIAHNEKSFFGVFVIGYTTTMLYSVKAGWDGHLLGVDLGMDYNNFPTGITIKLLNYLKITSSTNNNGLKLSAGFGAGDTTYYAQVSIVFDGDTTISVGEKAKVANGIIRQSDYYIGVDTRFGMTALAVAAGIGIIPQDFWSFIKEIMRTYANQPQRIPI